MQGVLVFSAAGTRLAVSVGDVLRLVLEEDITPVPFGHRALAGLMRLGVVRDGGQGVGAATGSSGLGGLGGVGSLGGLGTPSGGFGAVAGVVVGQRAAAEDVVPIFDLRGLVEYAPRPARHVEGATVAVIPTPRGLIGLRLDKLLGTAAGYVPDERDPPEALANVVDGAGVAREGQASAEIGTDAFFFFSTEAFIAALGI